MNKLLLFAIMFSCFATATDIGLGSSAPCDSVPNIVHLECRQEWEEKTGKDYYKTFKPEVYELGRDITNSWKRKGETPILGGNTGNCISKYEFRKIITEVLEENGLIEKAGERKGPTEGEKYSQGGDVTTWTKSYDKPGTQHLEGPGRYKLVRDNYERNVDLRKGESHDFKVQPGDRIESRPLSD